MPPVKQLDPNQSDTPTLTITNTISISISSPNSNNKNKRHLSSYRSIHTDYQPFLKYIRNHEGIDDATVERYERKFGGTTTSTTTTTKTMSSSSSSSSSISATSTTVGGFPFRDQVANVNAAMTKQELDDARHADLHANYKPSSYADEDKIFLLKREIDTLRGQLKATSSNNGNSSGNSGSGGTIATYASTNSNSNGTGWNPFASTTSVSVLLIVCLLLVATRSLKRRIAGIRSSGSLLNQDEAEAAAAGSGSSCISGSSGSSSSSSNALPSSRGWFELSSSSSSSSPSVLPSFGTSASLPSWVPPGGDSEERSSAQISFL
eukprot:jgi/Psemu1/70689/estExt_Genemark1.C_34990001